MRANIEWHKSCLNGLEKHLSELEENLKKLTHTVQCIRDEKSIYERQIGVAMRTGKKSFDRDIFLVKKSETK